MRCFNDYSLQTADSAVVANCGNFVPLLHANTRKQNPLFGRCSSWPWSLTTQRGNIL
jgi:hypothetical protein